MELTGVMLYLNRIFEWITKLACANLLWLMFVMLGLGIFGFMPATSAMFAVARKWMHGETDIRLLPTFWHAYKSEFMRANLIGLGCVIIGAILVFDILFFQTSDHLFYQMSLGVMIMLCLIYCLVLVYIFPLLAHYDLKIVQLAKHAFIIGICHPFTSLLMLLTTAVIGMLTFIFPPLIFLFSISVWSLALMWLAQRAILSIEHKKKRWAKDTPV